MDVMSYLPTSTKGDRYIFTLHDLYSSWPEAYAIPAKKAETVLLTEFIPYHGMLEVIMTDNTGEFCNELMKQLLSIHHIKSMPCHPSSNAQAERFHWCLATLISMNINDWDSNWDQFLNQVLFANQCS